MKENQLRLSDAEYLRFQEFILKHSGLHFPENRRKELEKGVMEALENAPVGITNAQSYFAYLNRSDNQAAQDELDRFINLFTIGETHFFRNTAQFEALASHILPALIAEKRKAAALVSHNADPMPQLRIWSAGCATGEEPYSIAMLLRDLIPDIKQWRIFILGTDINADSLMRARAGIYRDWSFREAEAKKKRQIYFERDGANYRLKDVVRRQVTFAQHNLIEDDYPSASDGTVCMDLILCRNVTIYFPHEVTEQLIKKFHATLVDGGWLLVGHAEPSLTAYKDFTAYAYPKAILYQKAPRPRPSKNGNGSMSERKFDSNPTMQLHTARLQTARLQTSRLHTARLGDQMNTRKLDPNRTRPGLGQSHTGFSEQPPPVTARLKQTAAFQAAVAEAEKAAAKRYEEAQLLLQQGKIGQAIQILEALLSENKRNVPACCLLARAFANVGQYLQARFWIQQAIKYDSLNPKAYYLLAVLDENEGLLGQAIENFKKMIYIDVNNPLPHFHLAALYSKVGKAEMAQRALNSSIRSMEKLPKDHILPENGESVGWLLQTAREMLKER